NSHHSGHTNLRAPHPVRDAGRALCDRGGHTRASQHRQPQHPGHALVHSLSAGLPVSHRDRPGERRRGAGRHGGRCMNPALLDYYNKELAYLREMGAEFAAGYPKVAARLGMNGTEVADPYVERLLEGTAFLTARI